MKCFRHDPGKVCPDCGLDRTMKTPKEILQSVLREHNVYFDAAEFITALESEGYQFGQAAKYPHTVTIAGTEYSVVS